MVPYLPGCKIFSTAVAVLVFWIPSMSPSIALFDSGSFWDSNRRVISFSGTRTSLSFGYADLCFWSSWAVQCTLNPKPYKPYSFPGLLCSLTARRSKRADSVGNALNTPKYPIIRYLPRICILYLLLPKSQVPRYWVLGPLGKVF